MNRSLTLPRRHPRLRTVPKAACAILAAVVLLSGCGTPPPGRFRRAPLVGVVSDIEGHPVAGAEVTLDGRHEAHTGMDGRFTFPRVRRGRHELVADAEGSEEMRVEITFTDRRQIAYVRLTSKDHLVERAVDLIAAGELAAATEMLERASKIDSPGGRVQLDADVALLEGIIRYRRGDRQGALEAIEPLLADPRTRGAADRLSAAIRGDPLRTR